VRVTIAHDLARFAVRSSWSDLSPAAKDALEIRVLDALGCAFGALGAEPVDATRSTIDELGGRPSCTLIGGGRSAPDRAAFFNGALIRYLDFNDAYLAPGETCHPSDSLSAVLAATEHAGRSGRTLLTALAVAYQVQCRLSDEAPVRSRGFDHTTQGACAVAAGVSRALGLPVERAANAIAIAVTTSPALRVTRTGSLSHWKGLAAPHAALVGLHAAFLAKHGITGPSEAFEGNKGFFETITGPFTIDWSTEDLERVTRTSLKRYNAEAHAQSAIEGLLELLHEAGDRRSIRRIEIDVFDVAHRIIGGGEEGAKTVVRTKEEADHSLPYMIAVAALDGMLMPQQYAPGRITRADVQELMRRVVVRVDPTFSARFPREHACRVHVELEDGRVLVKEKRDYLGFSTRPMSWNAARSKFDDLAAQRLTTDERAAIVDAVARLEERGTEDLCASIARGGNASRAPSEARAHGELERQSAAGTDPATRKEQAGGLPR
jgi:2-methylcitrate dehydratase